jgi:hypothetical protein
MLISLRFSRVQREMILSFFPRTGFGSPNDLNSSKTRGLLIGEQTIKSVTFPTLSMCRYVALAWSRSFGLSCATKFMSAHRNKLLDDLQQNAYDICDGGTELHD